MAIILPPVTVPEHLVYPEERSAELHIFAPVVGLPQIRIVNQHVDRDAEGNPVEIGPVETNHPYMLNMLEFLIMCPELSDIPGRISDAMDAMKLKMPDRRYVPPQPTLTSLGTTSGSAAGGNTIVLHGTLFGYTMAAKFGDANWVQCQVASNTLAVVVVPPGVDSTVVDVTILLTGNTSTLPQAYTYTT